MYVSNPDAIKSQKYYCTEKLAKFLTDKGISLLAKKDGLFVFAMTDALILALESAPCLMKFFSEREAERRKSRWEKS